MYGEAALLNSVNYYKEDIMAYTPTNWANGDVITSEKLNKMEQGIASGGSGSGFYVLHTTITSDEQSGTLSYTNVELQESGLPIILVVEQENLSVTQVGICYLVGYVDTSIPNAVFRYRDIDNNVFIVDRQTGEVSSPID